MYKENNGISHIHEQEYVIKLIVLS